MDVITDVVPTIGDPDGEPLIYTKLGNLPERLLEFKVYRQDTHGNAILAKEWYYNGEMVKRSVDVLKLDTMLSEDIVRTQTGILGG